MEHLSRRKSLFLKVLAVLMIVSTILLLLAPIAAGY